VLLKKLAELFVKERFDRSLHRRIQFAFRLALKLRLRDLYRDHSDQAFANVIARDRWVLFFQELILLRVLIDRLGQCRPKAGKMRSAIRIWNRIRERQNLVVVTVVVLQDNIDKHFVALARDRDRLRVNDGFIFAQLLHELLDAMFVKEQLFLHRIGSLIRQNDFQTGDYRIEVYHNGFKIGENVRTLKKGGLFG